jgi:hypothetical protein
MKTRSAVLALGLIAGCTVAGAVMHGSMTGRWGQSDVLATVGAKLREVPDQFGKWRLLSSETFSQAELNELECAGHFVREYRHEDTGAIVSVTMLVGPAMPTSLHTPEVCFPSREFKRLKGFPLDEQVVGEDGSVDTFTHSVFRSTRWGGIVHTYYAWSTGGPWIVPELDPRISFVGKPYLYKIQVGHNVPETTAPGKDEVIREFLKDFIPLASQYMLVRSPE